jgi:hypothetical protein
MKQAATRKVTSRVSPKLSARTLSKLSQGKKLFLVEQDLWTFAERLSLLLAQAMPEETLELEERIKRALFTMVHVGEAIRSTDDSGNLIIKSADKLPVEAGFEAGRLHVRGYYYPDREH